MDYKAFWLTALTRLEPTIARGTFLTWFKNTTALGIENDHLTIGAPTAFARDWLSSKYALKILQACKEQEAALAEIEFVVDATLADGADPRTVDLQAHFAKAGDKKVRRVAGTQEIKVTSGGLRSARLNPRYTLANFVSGEGNRLAHAAALSVARLPGQTYNPLFIYGGVGLGKTHLLSAIGHEVITNDPTKVVVYKTAEDFMNEYVTAVKAFKTHEFRRKYRDADCFLLDDVQFLEGGEKTQIEFFNVFNALHNSGAQIVITSDRPPSELTEIMDRLRSRMTWGLVTEIEQPDFTSRLAILQSKTQERRAIMDAEVLEFIARNVTDSVRALEGLLVTVLAESDLLHTQPTIRSVGRLIQKLNRRERIVGLPETVATEARSPAQLIQLVATQFGVSIADMHSSSRRKEIKTARGVAMYLLREIQHLGLASIGEQFTRTHATALHAINRIQTDITKDAQLVGQINAVKQEMGL